MKKVIVFGTFDILHPGHIHMLKEAKGLGDYLVAVIARDETVRQVKGRPPRNNENARLKDLEALGLVDKARLGFLDDKYRVLVEEKPDVVALGYDQKNFVDELTAVVGPDVRIVRLAPYMPEKYKSSLMENQKLNIKYQK